MKTEIMLLGALALSSVVAGGCAERKGSGSSELLVVELIPEGLSQAEDSLARITLGEYRLEVARMRLEREETVYARPLPPELKEIVLEAMVDRRLVALEAKRLEVAASTVAVERELAAMKAGFPAGEFQRLLGDTYQTENDLRRVIENRLTAMRLLEEEALSKVEIEEREITELWDALPADEKTRPGRIHATQIVVRTEEAGREVLTALRKGEDFAALARRLSVAPEAAQGGDLGWFARGERPQSLEDLCFPLKPGQTSELTASEYGYHLCRVLEAEGERPLTLEEVRPALLEQLRTEKMRQAEEAYIAGLRAKVRIVKNEGLLGSVE